MAAPWPSAGKHEVPATAVAPFKPTSTAMSVDRRTSGELANAGADAMDSFVEVVTITLLAPM
jgi:hypothetical protein